MEGVQAELALAAARTLKPELDEAWRELYRWDVHGEPTNSPEPTYAARLQRTVRELCEKVGLNHRVPRHVPAGPLAVNKRIAEQLFLKAYDLELELAHSSRIWAYRRAAWTVDEYDVSLMEIHREGGETALRQLPGIGVRLAAQIGAWLMSEGSEAQA